MAQNVTVLSMMTGSRNLSDSMGDPSVSDAELVDRLDRGAKLVYGRLVDRLESKYAYSTYDFTTAAGQESYAQPSDLYKLYGMDMYAASGTAGTFVSLRPYSFRSRDRRQQDLGLDWRTGQPVPGYSHRGGAFYLSPPPTTARAVRVHYAPTMPSLTSSIQTFDGIAGWDDFVVCHAARYVLAKRQAPTGDVNEMLKEAASRVDAECQFRDVGEPEPLSDDNGDWGFGPGGGW